MQHTIHRFRSLLRQLLALAVIAAVPQIASAQFTTFIPPKPKAVDSAVAAAATQQKAKADSVAQAHVTNMQTWVDSAAGIAAPPIDTSVVDTAAKVNMNAVANAADTTVTFRNGARAPATASSLPLLATLGAVLLLFGAVLLRMGRPELVRARNRSRERA